MDRFWLFWSGRPSLRNCARERDFFVVIVTDTDIPSIVHYLIIKYQATVPLTLFFHYIVSTIPSWKCLKLSPHAGVDLTPHTTTLPATTFSGRLSFIGYFCFLRNFCQWFLAMSQFFPIEQIWSYHGNSQNSAHIMSSASHPTSLHCQQEQTGVGIFLL